MTELGERICRLAQESAEADDPDQALGALSELRRDVDSFVHVQVERALHAGHSFSDVARALGISRQAAHHRFRGLAPARRRETRRPLAPSDAARHIVRLARAEALAARTTPGSEHVLLGVLRTDSATTRALRGEGLTAERVRAEALSRAAELARGRRSSSLPRIVKRAAHVALNRGDHVLDVQPLLLAAVADPDGGARCALMALGCRPEAVQR